VFIEKRHKAILLLEGVRSIFYRKEPRDEKEYFSWH
jgi:hypothetical protein